MSKRPTSAAWFWVVVAVACFVGFSGILAATTHDEACGSPNAPKEWQVFPPQWRCT